MDIRASKLKTMFDFFREVHATTRSISKWLFWIVAPLTLIAAVMIFRGIIVADLSLDDDVPLNPYLALAALSGVLVFIGYVAAFLLVAMFKLIKLIAFLARA